MSTLSFAWMCGSATYTFVRWLFAEDDRKALRRHRASLYAEQARQEGNPAAEELFRSYAVGDYHRVHQLLPKGHLRQFLALLEDDYAMLEHSSFPRT